MKYFTKEWYQEMQVAGFLVFPETKEEWDEIIEYFLTEEIDYKKNFKEDLERRKADLLKYLPHSFHPYIDNGILNSEYPSVELRNMAEQWQKEYQERMDALQKAYSQHYQSIKNLLPKNVVQLHENSLHDARVTAFEIPSEDIFIIHLDCRGGFYYFRDVKLTFLGVSKLSNHDQLQDAWWLYDEVYLSETGFELNILLDCPPLNEFTIVAENVLIE